MRLVATAEVEPRVRGRAYGSAVRDEVEASAEAYAVLFDGLVGASADDVLRFGDRVLAGVATWRPPLLEELEGVAEGAGQRPELIAALNARTELLALQECSLMARTESPEGPWLAQNWDWYTDAAERCVLWSAATPDATYVTMTEAGMLAKLGLSSRGVAVGLNILAHTRDRRSRPGTPVHLLLREILATCATVDEAAEVLADAEPSASSAITVVDARGGGAVFEVSPVGVARIAPRDGALAHTNHFLDPDLRRGEARLDVLDRSVARLETGCAGAPSTVEEALEALRRHDGEASLCRHDEPSPIPGLPSAGTMATFAARPADGWLAVSEGPPCRGELEEHTVAGAVAAG
jgi:isopenicillin-N N-acyltransferase-like protein